MNELAIAILQSSVSQALQSEVSEVSATVKIVTQLVMVIASVGCLIKAGTIFMSQGSGEEKIGKVGTWLFLVLFFATAAIIVPKIFGL
jgi:hypothetical protein